MIEMALAEPIRQDIVEIDVVIDDASGDTECPDCHTALTQYYDWDILQYVCENCGTELEQASFRQGY